MRLKVTGKGMELSDYLENLVEKKANKLECYFRPETEVQVTLSIEKSRHICEVTVPFDGVTLRTEEVSGDMYNSIDASLKKLERQIRRHRTKLEKRLRDGAYTEAAPVYADDELMDAPLEDVVRRKRFPAKPMDIEEAKMQMELLGHSFFVFTNAETNEVNVLYKRAAGAMFYFTQTQTGGEVPPVLAGDMNGDGEITDADAIYLLRYTLFGDAYPLHADGDVNCDGGITDADAIYLLRYTLFGDLYPLYPQV